MSQCWDMREGGGGSWPSESHYGARSRGVSFGAWLGGLFNPTLLTLFIVPALYLNDGAQP